MKLSEAASVIPGLLEDLHSRLYDKYVTMVIMQYYADDNKLHIIRAEKDLQEHLIYTSDWTEFCDSLDQKKVS